MPLPLYVGIIITIIVGFLVAEFIGYWLHMLLHSNKIQWLSRGHMIHHLKIYGPKMPMRSRKYNNSTMSRASMAGIGMEWIVPLGLFVALVIVGGWLLNIPFVYTGVFLGSAIIYGFWLFSQMHSAMHLSGFWMLKNKFFRKWFLKARYLHDIHHIALDDQGRMNTNYGITFFFWDGVFGTKKPKLTKFNEKGFKATKKRYAFVLKEK